MPWVSNSATSGRGSTLNAYLRLGSAERASFVLESYSPSETFGAIGLYRMGMAINRALCPGTSAFFGVSADPFPSMRAFADLAIPAARGLDVLLRGEIGSGHQYTPYSLAVGARYRFVGS